MKQLLSIALISITFAFLSTDSVAVSTPANDGGKSEGACPADSDQPLSFWLGRWDAFADGKLDGHSFIESVLGGCAVLEHWSDASGFEGMSLFYLDPHLGQWKQVWVTDHALSQGGMKEKSMIFSGVKLVQFQGRVWIGPGRSILDRTTLRQLPDGSVNQLIEYSKDGGATWSKTYDSVYHRQSRVPPAK